MEISFEQFKEHISRTFSFKCDDDMLKLAYEKSNHNIHVATNFIYTNMFFKMIDNISF